MSTDNISATQWRVGVFALAGTVLIGGLLVLALASGLADPHHAGSLRWQTGSADEWPLMRRIGRLDLYQAPIPLPSTPFTLELTAVNRGPADSAWGLWLECEDGIRTILVSNEDYLSVTTDTSPHWSGFLHIHPGINRIYLDLQGNYTVTLRVNDEIAWFGVIKPRQDWGIARYRAPLVAWDSIAVYAQ